MRRIFLEISRTRFSQNKFDRLLLEIIYLALSYRGTPRLSYTFVPAIMLDTKSEVKINYHVPITSGTKFRINIDIFLNKILDKI